MFGQILPVVRSEEGVTFDSAYTNSPVRWKSFHASRWLSVFFSSVPPPASLWSVVAFHPKLVHGTMVRFLSNNVWLTELTILSAAQMASDVPTYAHFLRRMGYHTALSGKQVQQTCLHHAMILDSSAADSTSLALTSCMVTRSASPVIFT